MAKKKQPTTSPPDNPAPPGSPFWGMQVVRFVPGRLYRMPDGSFLCLIPVHDLLPDPRNPPSRTNNPNNVQLRRLVSSYLRYGVLGAKLCTLDAILIDGHRSRAAMLQAGIEYCLVHILLADAAQSSEIFGDANATQERHPQRDLLYSFLEDPQRVVERVRSRYINAMNRVGRPCLEAIEHVRGDINWYSFAVAVANYCDRGDDDAFLRRVIHWEIRWRTARELRVETIRVGMRRLTIDNAALLNAVLANRPFCPC